MHTLYNFLTGPMVWVAFIVFICGSLYKLVNLIILTYKKEPFIFSYMSLKYSLRSILHWLTPFGTVNMKRHPAMTVATFAFHICLFLAPIFLLSHIILWEEAFNISWWAMPDMLADFMTIVVVGTCAFFLVRRIISPEVKFVTSKSDYIILAIVAAPFITGFWAYHQWTGYKLFLLLHILSGEIMLMAIPFTRLSHMIFSPLTRAYTGSEFGGIRHAIDW